MTKFIGKPGLTKECFPTKAIYSLWAEGVRISEEHYLPAEALQCSLIGRLPGGLSCLKTEDQKKVGIDRQDQTEASLCPVTAAYSRCPEKNIWMAKIWYYFAIVQTGPKLYHLSLLWIAEQGSSEKCKVWKTKFYSSSNLLNHDIWVMSHILNWKSNIQ